jgi:hypothetical protein
MKAYLIYFFTSNDASDKFLEKTSSKHSYLAFTLYLSKIE